MPAAMVRLRMRHVFLMWVAFCIVAACGGDGSPVLPDAAPSPSDGAPLGDAALVTDASLPLSWVDFTIAGCDMVDPDKPDPTCRGQAPLALQFTVLASAPIEIYVWSFGDGSESNSPFPTHVFAHVGTYDISLTVRGPGGTASVTYVGVVEVSPAALGATCDLDGQCADGGDCVCDQDTSCPRILRTGLCSAPCDASQTCTTGVCADLAAAAPPAPADWQRALCLVECQTNDQCPDGLTCQELPLIAPQGDTDTWGRACFVPGILRAAGESCKDATGTPQHESCAGGLCLDMGARGACSAPCTARACPQSAACADFGDISACLARCDEADVCRQDPWLACELATTPSSFPGEFAVDEDPPDPAGYCATKRCSDPADCPDGACVDGLCAAAP